MTPSLHQQSAKVTVITDEKGEPWWVAGEVCRILGLKNVSQVTGILESDERDIQKVETPGGPQRCRIVNEPGLYNLILQSRKPQAHEFKRWITHKVLPQIFKTGGYIPVKPGDTDKDIMARGLVVAMKTIEERAGSGRCLLKDSRSPFQQLGVPVTPTWVGSK